ncbi:MAG TPA: glycosyltransferase family 9 protein [Candidatus Baltobacteraceae bacterium]|nr:glycosyltransferase family 9 protein [Candidatus Baltobacteraceae bacterium]
MMPTSPSVLVIRLDAIGDALALVPLLDAFRERAIPTDVLLSPSNAGVFSSRAVREVIVAHEVRPRSSHGRDNRAAIARLANLLRFRAYTHVLVATEDPAGYRLARETQAPVRVGFTNLWGKPFKTLWSRSYVNVRVYRSAGLDPRAPHECEVLFRLGTPLLGEDATPSRDPHRLRPLVLEDEPTPDRRVAVQISDKWERLGIAFAAVVEMVRQCSAHGELRLLSSESESAYADRIEAATAFPVERFSTLYQWKSAIGAARAIVTPDSGALHVAGFVGTPVAAIFPPGRNFRLQVARWLPWAAPYRIVRADEGWPARAAGALAQLL